MKQILKKLSFGKVAQFIAMSAMVLMPVVALVPQASHAQLIDDYIDDCDENLGLRCNEGSLADLFKTFISWALGIAFIVAVVMLIVGGFQYVVSGGNADAATGARTRIFNALIGIVIIVLSYVIVQIVYRFITGTQ